jgi:alpha-L-fucosidase 2
MVARLPPYRVNADGSLAEWIDPAFTENHAHRHQSQLYPLFPGIELTPEGTPELHAAAAKALEQRGKGSRGHESSWGLANMASCYARVGDGDGALRCLDLISRSCVLGNFFTAHNDWRDMGIGVEDCPLAPVQIDANMGWTEAVHELILFSSPGVLKLLPALPSTWLKGRVSGLRCRGAFTVDIAWDMGADPQLEFVVHSARAAEIAVQLPFAADIRGILATGSSVRQMRESEQWVAVTVPGGEPARFVFGRMRA